jgi:hypothetical protein
MGQVFAGNGEARPRSPAERTDGDAGSPVFAANPTVFPVAEPLDPVRLACEANGWSRFVSRLHDGADPPEQHPWGPPVLAQQDTGLGGFGNPSPHPVTVPWEEEVMAKNSPIANKRTQLLRFRRSFTASIPLSGKPTSLAWSGEPSGRLARQFRTSLIPTPNPQGRLLRSP